MNIEVRMAIMSHLSDAQELGLASANASSVRSRAKLTQEQNHHINFAKYLLIKFKDINQEVSEDELNKIWSELK